VKVGELLKTKRKYFERTQELTAKKGIGYGVEEDTLRNLRLTEYVGAVSTELGTYTRLCDKVFRIGRHLKGGKLPYEKLEDDILDAINYLFYILAVVEEKTHRAKPPKR
jgi:hypothetical protein